MHSAPFSVWMLPANGATNPTNQKHMDRRPPLLVGTGTLFQEDRRGTCVKLLPGAPTAFACSKVTIQVSNLILASVEVYSGILLSDEDPE